MKSILLRTAAAALCCLTLTTFTSCEDDDDELLQLLTGPWRAQEVIPYNSYSAPYRPGDVWYFFQYGAFATYRYSDKLEEGDWYVRGSEIRIDLDGDYDPDIYARIDRISEGYLSLTVKDYGSTYEYGYSRQQRYKIMFTYDD